MVLLIHADHEQYGMCRRNLLYSAFVFLGVNWHIYMNFEGIPWNIIFQIPGHWRYFWHIRSYIVKIYYTIVQMKGYSIMENYSLVEWGVAMPYNFIWG